MNRKVLMFIGFLMSISIFIGCSNDNDEPKELLVNSVEEGIEGAPVDSNEYRYKGYVILKDSNDKNIYRIGHLVMAPSLSLYNQPVGYMIPIPLPEYECEILFDLGANTVIDNNAVIYTVDGVEYEDDMPAEGVKEYIPGFSISRLSQDKYSVHIKPIYFDTDDILKIMMRPIPAGMYNNVKHGSAWLDFVPTEAGVPEIVPVRFCPYTFRDCYRPFLQMYLTEYR